ncbi:MAG: mCpol domain-containing protein [Bacteroidota bacterium]
MGKVYAFLDGDSIGTRLEELLSKSKALEAALLSETIKTAMLEIDRLLSSKDDVEIIILGGDDVLIQYEYEIYGTEIVHEIIHTFKTVTGLSMSCGIGLSINQSILSLDAAKKNGKNLVKTNLGVPLSKMSEVANLYIFVDSEIPDVYINSIVCCCEEKKGYDLKHVYFVGITRDKNSAALKAYIDSLEDRVRKQLELLQIGRYLYKDRTTEQWQERDIDIQNYNRLRYAAARSLEFHTDAILYGNLKTRLCEYINKSEVCIFDVSAVKKTFLIDVYTILRLNKVDRIFTFELKGRGRTYDDRELIHNRSFSNGEYDYSLLTGTDYVSGSVVRNVSQSDLNPKYVSNLDDLVDSYSDEIARIYLFLILVCALIILAICIYIVFNDGWTWLEAWTFIALVPAVYVLSILMKIIWSIDFTLNPDTLYKRFKLWKAKKIRRKIR